MKHLLLLTSILLNIFVHAQKQRIDFARNETSAERKEIIETWKVKMEQSLGIQPAIVLDHLYIQKNFAFLKGKIRDLADKAIDFTKISLPAETKGTTYAGEETTVLLKKLDNTWIVLTFLISSTNYSWACWWAEYAAPKGIFDFTDYCR